MVFSSIEFLFRFLPIFFIIYFCTKARYRNVVLLFGSLFFYAYGEPLYILLMFLSIYVNYFIAERIHFLDMLSERTGKHYDSGRRNWLITAMVYNFGMLFFFKYLDFFIGIVNGVLGADVIPQLHLSLPLGISFYTFQMASYMIDVYRRTYESERNLLNFATYVVMFPQLIAGPIVNYLEVRKELIKRKTDFRWIEWGLSLFLLGLAYKVLIANKIASLWNSIQTVGPHGISVPTAWLGAWGYSMQIFFDFFGYSLMAMGLGRILGFRLPINFKDPYCAVSATEFWRRWHITLGRWFREYVYIPLGGNRKGKARLFLNIFIVWFLTGLWHGANWNFIIWGLFYFVILILEKFFLLKRLEQHRILGHLYMLLLIPVSWTIFNITDLPTLGLYLKRMFFIPLKGMVQINGAAQFFQFLGQYWWLFLVCIFGCTPWPVKLLQRYYKTWACRIILLLLFWMSVYQLMCGADNPFLYFRF